MSDTQHPPPPCRISFPTPIFLVITKKKEEKKMHQSAIFPRAINPGKNMKY